MLQGVRKYKKWLAGLSLAIFVLPLFYIFCQSCLSSGMSEQLTFNQASYHVEGSGQSCCEQEQAAAESPPIVATTDECCEPEISDNNTSEIVLTLSNTQTEKFILVSQLSPTLLSSKVRNSDKFISLNLAHAKLFFRNPVLLN